MEIHRPPERLRASVLSSIKSIEYRRARMYLAASGTALLISVIGLILAVQSFVQALYASEFYSYATLVFSDTDVALRFWKDIVLSLAESLPVFAIIAVLGTMLLALVSIRVMVKNIKTAFTPSFGA